MQANRDVSLAVLEKARVLISGRAVVVFTVSGCCMGHVVKQLLFGMGVAPTVLEMDGGADVDAFIRCLSGETHAAVPAVFVGGRFLGGVERVMACHINGTLVPLLKDVGALWL